jgi:glycosyltransferase involved in cell wall biosynthesis
MKPLVSILIPAYNAEPWIADTINSSLRQTWPQKEIIVVDDGSKDRTLKIAEKFIKEGVQVVSQKNQGASTARNKAFSLCRGDYIQWLDADDMLEPEKISKQMEYVENNSSPRLLLSSEWGRFFFCIKRAKFIKTPLWEDLQPVEWLHRKMSQNIWMQPGNWLVSRELTEAAGPWDERLSFDDDGEYFCRVLLKSHGVKFIPGARTFYRVTGPGSLSNVDKTDKKLDSAWLSMRLHIQYLRSLEESERVHEAIVKYLQTWLSAFDPYRLDIVREMKDLSEALGGRVKYLEMVDSLRWKFAWMQSLFGRRFAFWAQSKLPQLKHATVRQWDRALFYLGN